MTEFFRAIGNMIHSGFTWAAFFAALLALEKYYEKWQTRKMLYLIAKKVGVEWDTPQEEFRKMARQSYKRLYSLSHKATKRQKRRMNMKAYLKKLGKTKFQAFLIITFTNIIMLIGSVTGWVDIDGKINEWMPAINLIVQLIATLVYTHVEGAIDKASIQASAPTPTFQTTGSSNVFAGVQNAEFKTPVESTE